MHLLSSKPVLSLHHTAHFVSDENHSLQCRGLYNVWDQHITTRYNSQDNTFVIIVRTQQLLLLCHDDEKAHDHPLKSIRRHVHLYVTLVTDKQPTAAHCDLLQLLIMFCTYLRMLIRKFLESIPVLHCSNLSQLNCNGNAH